MARPVAKLGVTLVLCASLAACGQTHIVGPHRTLRLALTEYRLRPQRVQAKAGQLTILVHNYGRLTHDLAVSRGGHTASSTQPIPPGGNTELVLTLRPGQYLMASTILYDQDLGLYGTLVVRWPAEQEHGGRRRKPPHPRRRPVRRSP
jgi:hypothetical protein